MAESFRVLTRPVQGLIATALLLLALNAPAHATCAAIPYSFTNGSLADATQVNQDFTTLLNCINALDAGQVTTGHLAVARGGTNADLSATGGTSQFLRQNSIGAAITVVRPAASDLSDGTTGTGSVVLSVSPNIQTPIFNSLVSSTGSGLALCWNNSTGAVTQGANGDCNGNGVTGSGATVRTSSPSISTPLLTSLANLAEDAYVCRVTSTGLVAFNSTCGPSDERLKTDWGSVPGLSAILALHPGSFDWIDVDQAKAGRQIGLKAQEVEKVLPLAVTTGGDRDIHFADGSVKTIHHLKAVDYAKMVVPLIVATQELQAEIDQLKKPGREGQR